MDTLRAQPKTIRFCVDNNGSDDIQWSFCETNIC